MYIGSGLCNQTNAKGLCWRPDPHPSGVGVMHSVSMIGNINIILYAFGLHPESYEQTSYDALCNLVHIK